MYAVCVWIENDGRETSCYFYYQNNNNEILQEQRSHNIFIFNQLWLWYDNYRRSEREAVIVRTNRMAIYGLECQMKESNHIQHKFVYVHCKKNEKIKIKFLNRQIWSASHNPLQSLYLYWKLGMKDIYVNGNIYFYIFTYCCRTCQSPSDYLCAMLLYGFGYLQYHTVPCYFPTKREFD